MSRKYPFFGYRKITQKLRNEGWAVGKKLVQRVRREEHLQVPAPKPRRRRQGLSTGLPTEALRRNHVWSWDFVSDYTQRGGKLRVFNLIDEYTRECHCIHSDRAIKAEDVLTLLQGAIAKHEAPEFIRSDNGPEFIAKCIQRWLSDNQIKTLYIDPGCPWQNGFVESFNEKFRRVPSLCPQARRHSSAAKTCLNRELIYTLSESRVIFDDYRHLHNHERPHRSLGLLTPAQFAKQPNTGSGSVRPTASLRQNLKKQTNQHNNPTGKLS